MDKILIFGGTGFLGMNLIREYISDYDIYIFSRDEAKQWKVYNEYPSVKCFLGDIRDRRRVERTINRIRMIRKYLTVMSENVLTIFPETRH